MMGRHQLKTRSKARLISREPAKWLGLISALLSLLSVTLTHWTPDQQAAVNSVISVAAGVVGAFAVSEEKALPLLAGLVQAVLACAMAFGLHLTATQQGAVMSFVAAGVAMWLRTQVTAPVSREGFSNTTKAVPLP